MENFLQPKKWEVCHFFFPKMHCFLFKQVLRPNYHQKHVKSNHSSTESPPLLPRFHCDFNSHNIKKKHSCNVSTPSRIVDFPVCFYPRFYEIPPTLQTLSPKALASKHQTNNIKPRRGDGLWTHSLEIVDVAFRVALDLKLIAGNEGTMSDGLTNRERGGWLGGVGVLQFLKFTTAFVFAKLCGFFDLRYQRYERLSSM